MHACFIENSWKFRIKGPNNKSNLFRMTYLCLDSLALPVWFIPVFDFGLLASLIRVH